MGFHFFGNSIAIREKEIAMKKDDQEILKEVQKNSRMAIKTIDIIMDKVSNDDLAYELARENLIYASLHNKAVDTLVRKKVKTYQSHNMEDMMLEGGIHMNTMWNVSTGKLAELIIRSCNTGMTSMWKVMNQYQQATNVSMEVAKEFLELETKSIERLKKYL